MTGVQTCALPILEAFAVPAYSRLMFEQARSGDLKGAQLTFHRIRPDQADTVVEVVATELNRQKVFDAAEAVAGWHTDASYLNKSRSDRAVVQLRNGDADAALKTMEGVDIDFLKAAFLIELAQVEISHHDLPSALATLEKCLRITQSIDAGIRPWYLLEVAAQQFAAHDVAGARATLQESLKVTDSLESVQQQKWRYQTAIYLSVIGDIDEAKAILVEFQPYANIAAHGLTEIARQQAVHGDRDGAEKSFRDALVLAKNVKNMGPLDSGSSRPNTLRDIGSAMITVRMSDTLRSMIDAESDRNVVAYLSLGAAEGFELRTSDGSGDRKVFAKKPVIDK